MRPATKMFLILFASIVVLALAAAPASSADRIEGHVLGAGAPIANSSVTLWAAGTGAPKQLQQKRTGTDGRFEMNIPNSSSNALLYLVAMGGKPSASKASGDNPAIALMTVLGNKPPAKVTINEMTTVASVWTHAQFLDGTAISGHALGLKIAAGNVPSFVDLATGGLGDAIQNSLNGAQTPTMANFNTLADALAGCVTRITADACSKLYAAAKGPAGAAPTDTLTAAESIAKYPWYEPKRVFSLLEAYYPIPKGKILRPVPYAPYLNFSPSAWVLPLKFDGGGYRGGGKAGFDSEGNLWTANNFLVGEQAQDTSWNGNASKFDPNGKPLSPATTGFTGGGIGGPGFGLAVDAQDNAWFSTYATAAIAVFDKNGKPLTPPDGITFDGRLGLMQGVMVAPNGDVWALGVAKSQLVHFPKGDLSKGRIVCEGRKDAEPCKSFVGPFGLGIDQQDRIWVTSAFGAHVTRFPASDPSKAEKFKTGYSGSGLGIDSQGNVWVANRLGNSDRGMFDVVEDIVVLKTGGNADRTLTRQMSKQTGEDGGSVTLLRPDGTHYPGSPFTGGGLPGPWTATVDGNDNVWVTNFGPPYAPLTQLCGVRTENCPPGFKTGDQISPPGGYVGGGLQMQVDVQIGPAGDLWVTNNWQNRDSCFGDAEEALSTLCGGQGVTIFYGMAKPVRTPQIGPPRVP